MEEKLLLNLFYIAVAILFWLLPVALRYMRKRQQQSGRPDGEQPWQAAGPADEVPDSFATLDGELRLLSLEAGEVELVAAKLVSSLADTRLAAFASVIDDAVARPAGSLRQALDASIASPEDAQPVAMLERAAGELARLRATASFMEGVVAEHGREGFVEQNARGVALARVFHGRIQGLASRIGPTPADPLFVPVDDPSRMTPTALAGLAGTPVIAFRARPGRSELPLEWAEVARDVVRWAYDLSDDLEPEIEQAYAAVLQSLGYLPQPPPTGLAREAFTCSVCALMLGDLSLFAFDAPGRGIPTLLARRTLELAGMSREDQGALPLHLEVMLHVMTGIELDALSGNRVSDDLEMRFDYADASRTRAAAEALAAETLPSVPAFHVIAGAMGESLVRRERPAGLARLVDLAIGVRRRDEWAQGRPASPARETVSWFVSARAVREAIVIGALLER